jgi:2-keto-4-pentenoate hydratase
MKIFAQKTQEAAGILMDARQTRTKISDLSVEMQPRNIEQAYELQDAIALRSGPIGGWKASFEPDGRAARVAPVARAYVHEQAGMVDIIGPARIEVEFAVKLGVDLPKTSSYYGREDVRSAIASAHVALEVLGHRFEDRKLVSPHVYLADGNGNDAIIIGDEIANWQSLDLTALNVRCSVQGQIRGETSEGASNERMLDLLAALANHAADHLDGLKAGHVVITGARVGPIGFDAGDVIEGLINNLAAVRARIV